MTPDPAVGIDQGPEAVSEVEQRANELLNGITPGQWRLWNGWGPASDGRMRVERIGTDDPTAWQGIYTSEESIDISGRREDLEFVAQAPQVVRDLLALVADLRQQQEQLQRKLADADGMYQVLDAMADANLEEMTKRAEAAEASLASLRREQEQFCGCRDFGDGTGRECAAHEEQRLQLEAAEATGAAAVSELQAAERRIESLCQAHEEAFIRADNAEQQLADRSAAIAQIVQEMRELLSVTRGEYYRSVLLKWIAKLDAVGAERPHQTKEQESST